MVHSRAAARFILAPFLVAAVLVLPACSALRQIAALRSVDFSVDRVGDVALAGIDLSRINSYDDIGLLDAGRLAAGVATRRLPLRLTVFVAASNPAANSVTARMVRMDWALFLNNTETVRGIVEQAVDIPSGQTVAIPVSVELNLVDFFDRGARDLVDLALGLSGQGGRPTDIRLRATPTVDTPIGPISYPRPIDIVRTRTGS